MSWTTPRHRAAKAGWVIVVGGRELLLTPQAAATCNTLTGAGISSGQICLIDLESRQLALLPLAALQRAVEEQWGGRRRVI